MKKEKNSVNEVKKIISEMFAFGKNIKFSGTNPEYVEFEIDANDYMLSYDEDLFMEYSEGVMKKRTHQVALKFYSKSVEGTIERPIYKIMFEIKLKPVSEIKFNNDDDMMVCWSFEEKPKQVVRFIKKRGHCDWDESTGRLTIKKSIFDNLDPDYLKLLISDEGGEKVRI